MVEDDTFTYQVKRQSAGQINTAAHSLITKERMQKLDLLIHLLSNLTQALVVCGPEGIGKTTLLSALQSRNTESWRYCVIGGNADLSFEAIHGQLTQCIKLDKTDTPVKSLSMAFKRYENQHKQIVVIVDNAGELVPGLVTAMIQYAAANPVLRLIFALTHDELQVKRGSDRAIDDCHIIEIPPLSEKQCGDFLQYLSTKPYANLSFKAIGENMITHIYRETHGVPGRIIAEVSGLSGAKQDGKLKWMLVIAIAVAIAIAIGVQWLISSNNSKEEIAPDEQKAGNIKAAPQRSESQVILPLPLAQPVIPQQKQLQPASEANEALKPPVEINTHSDDQQSVTSTAKPEVVGVEGVAPAQDNKQSVAIQQKVVDSLEEASQETLNQVELVAPNSLEVIQTTEKPIEVAAVPEKPVLETAAPQQAEPEKSWASPTNNFTLQLMVLSKQSSATDILNKYPAMGPDFRVVNIVANGKEKFILEYGSYPDAASANRAKQSLPFEFHNALVRKINSKKQR